MPALPPVPPVPPVPSIPLPVPPSSTDIATFDARGDAFNLHLQQHTEPEINALALNVFTNAGIAFESAGATLVNAGAAQDAKNDAQDAAQIAIAQATAVATASKISLGIKAADPATDNQGDPLLPGAWYYNNIPPGKVRVYTEAGWAAGIASVAGVTSVNGADGAVINIATTGANTYTEDQNFAGKQVVKPLLKQTLELRAAAAISGGVLAIDLANAITSVPLSANITSVTFTNNVATDTACQSHTLELVGSGTARTAVWPNGNGISTLKVNWPGAVAPALTTTSGKRDTFIFKSVSQFLWDAYVVGQNQ